MRSGKGKSNKKRYSNRKNDNKNIRRDVEIRNTAESEMRTDMRDARDCRNYRDNDPAWYAQNPQLLVDYASLPFGNPLGSRLPTSVVHDTSVDSVPGIMCLYYTPSIGVAHGETDPINIAMRNVYAYVRHQNSGSANYDGPDLMLYIIAMDSCYTYFAWIKRLYGQMMLYSNYNRYYPAALVYSEGVDFMDLQNNLANFRGYINQYAVKLNAMCVPASMSYMARHSWMASHIYVDDPSTPKAQTYKYVPEQYYQFGLDSEGAGMLSLIQGIIPSPTKVMLPVNLKKLSDIITLGDRLLNPIIANEDMNIMSGDILKAFGEGGIVKIAGITEDYVVLPEYSAEVLSQMENATVFNGVCGANITQTTAVGTGYLVSKPGCALWSTAIVGDSPTTASKLPDDVVPYLIAPYLGTTLLNFHKQEVTPADVMVATRLKVSVSEFTGGQVVPSIGHSLIGEVESCGSEIISNGRMIYFDYTTSEVPLLSTMVFYPIATGALIGGNTQFEGVAYRMCEEVARYTSVLSAFDWHPMSYVVPYGFIPAGGVYNSTVPKALVPQGDLANYTTLSPDNIANMNSIALLSEFTVPLAAKGM